MAPANAVIRHYRQVQRTFAGDIPSSAVKFVPLSSVTDCSEAVLSFKSISQPLGQYPNIWDNFLKIQNYLLSSSNLIVCLVKWKLSLPAPTTAQWYLWRKKKIIQYLDGMASEQERFQTIKSKFRNKAASGTRY